MRCILALVFAAACLGGERPLSLSNGQLEIRFDSRSGRWLSLGSPSSPPVLDGAEALPSLSITRGGRTVDPERRLDLWAIRDALSEGDGARLTGSRKTGNQLTLQQSDGDWRIEQQFTLDGDTLARRVRLTWTGAGETLLRWVDLRVPSHPTEGVLEAPGYPGILHQDISALPEGQWDLPEDRPDRDAPAWRMGVFTLTRNGRNIITWPFDREVPAIVSVHRGKSGVWLNHRLFVSCRLQPNQSVLAGTQYLRLAGGHLKTSLRQLQSFWAEAGLKPRQALPDWARDIRIFEINLGPFRGMTQYPDLDALTRDLPRIASLGFNVIQFMPRMPYPSYSVHDYRDIETHYAPESELKVMVRRAHELGIRVILDVIMHGVHDKAAQAGGEPSHPWVKQHPEWFSRRDDGALARTYTWAFDHANPDFQRFLIEVFPDYVRKLDIDGFRVDAVTWNFFPNWERGLPRPGYESIYASARLFERVREECERVKPGLLFVTESGGPLFHGSYDLFYNYDELWMYGGLLPLLPGTTSRGGNKIRIDARQLADWLELRRLTLPPSLYRIHQADSHDIKQSTNRFNRQVFGEAGQRLLFAFCAFLDGAVMNYAGAEAGLEDFYRQVLSLRGRHPALRTGDIDYQGATPSSPRVFAPIRRSGNDVVMPVLAFSGAPVSTTLDLAKLQLEPGRTYTLREAFTGAVRKGTSRELSRLSLELPPYAVQLWRIEP